MDREVSIHAPVWGAKLIAYFGTSKCAVSIHAPVWGAKPLAGYSANTACFNPRTRVGCEGLRVLASDD